MSCGRGHRLTKLRNNLEKALLIVALVGCGDNTKRHELRSITLAPSPITMGPGATVPVTATGLYSDGATMDLTAAAAWSSSDTTIASVGPGSSGAVVTAVGAGHATVTAAVGSITGTVAVTVTTATLQTLAVSPARASIARGTTQAFTASGSYSDGTTRDLTAMVTWSTGDAAVATMLPGPNDPGTAKAVAVGETQVTATLGAVTGAATLTVTPATLQAIDLTPAQVTLPAGESQAFVATGSYSDGTTQDITKSVTWTSSDATVASVSNAAGFEGTAAAVANGTATITATQDGKSGSATLSVTDAVLVSIGVTPATASLPLGTTATFAATGVYSDGTTHDLTARVTWSSSDATIVGLSNAGGSQGTATAVAIGSVTVTAALGGVSGTAMATVTSATLASIALDPAQLTLAAGLRADVTATGTYSDGNTRDLTTTVAWSSSDTTVLTVVASGAGAGKVTGVAAGTATLTASLGGVSASLSVVVTAATLSSLAITPDQPSLAAGTSQPLAATGTLSDGTTFDATAQVVWASSDPTVASVSNAAGSQGLVAGLVSGSVTVSATLGGVSASTTVTVTNARLLSISISPASPSVPNGLTETFTATGLYSDGSTQDLTAQVAWTSSDPTVAGISNAAGSAGLASALAVGSTTITAAAAGGISGQTTLTVVSATLVSLSVSPTNPTLAKGTRQAFGAVGIYSDGSSQDVTTQVTWSSSDATVIAVSNAQGTAGAGTCLAPGSATVSATLAGITGSTSVTVTSAVIVSLAIEPPGPSLASGTTLQLAAIATYSDATAQDVTGQVTWGSSDGTVATVSNAAGERGLVRALATGSATASAQLAGVMATTTVTVTAATLTSLSVSPANPSIAKGTSQQMVATGTYSDGSSQDLTAQVAWSSSDGTVAAVGNAPGTSGLATAVGTGSATVTASFGGVTGSTQLTVTSAVLVSISVSPPSLSLANGTSQRLAATGTYSDATTQDLTAQVSWTSSDGTIAIVSNGAGTQGRVTGVAVGMATISATLGGVAGSAVVTVTSAVLTSIALTPAMPSLAKGTTLQMTATGGYSDGTTQDLTTQVAWSSGDTTVAVVSNAAGSQGRVTGAGSGGTTLSATLAGVTGSTTVTVTAATLVSIAITPMGPSLAKGTQTQLAASGMYTDGSVQDLTGQASWTSSDATVAVVSNGAGTQGRVTGAGVGTATVSATLSGIAGSTTVTVTSAQLVSIALTPTAPSLAKGTSLQMTATGTYSDGTNQDVTPQAAWSSTDGTVAGVSNAAGSQGRLTGTGAGGTMLSATLAGITGSTTVTVTAATLVSIGVTPTSPSLAKGTTLQLTATGVYSDSSKQDLTTQVAWSTSAPAVATVSNAAGTQGRVTARGAGMANVTALLGGVSGTTTVTVTAAILTTIDLGPVDPTMAAATQLPFTATGTFSDGTIQDITAQVSWVSSNNASLTVSNSPGSQGLATGVTPGTAVVSATLSGITGTSTVTVTAAALTSLAITPANPRAAKGTQVQFTATGTFADGSTQDVTTQVTWASSQAAVASVSNATGTEGLATGLLAGTTTISATLSGVSSSTTMTVTNVVLSSISVTPAARTLARGYRLQFTATAVFSDGSTQNVTAQATWTSTSTGVATVTNGGTRGLATGVAAGTTTISASFNGVVGTTTLTVTNATLSSIAVTPATVTLSVKQQFQLTATGTFSDGTTLDITTQAHWTTSNANAASVNGTGLAHAHHTGAATISAALGGQTGTAAITVN